MNNDHADVASSVLGDIDSDGYMEIMMISDGQIQGFNHNGSKIDHFPVPFYHREIGLSPPVLGDVDGEGHVDLVVSTTQGNIEAYQYDGTRVDGFPLSVGGTIAVSPALFDLDNDGRIELAAVSGEGSLYIWDLAGEFSNDAVPWGSYLRDPQHTGRNAQQLQLTPSTQEFFPSRSAYNYPNPNIDDYTVIRYHLEQPAEVQIKIFDLAGELIEELNGPGLGPADNEVIWPLENIDSGTYFCQIRAAGQQEEKMVTIKIAVVK